MSEYKELGITLNRNEVTKKLGEAYKKWKDAEAEKDKLRDEFFLIANTEAENHTLARRTVTIPPADYDDWEEYVETYYPKWNVLATYGKGGEVHSVTLEEKPEFHGYQYVNKEDGQVYVQQISDGSPKFDAERFKRDHPDKWIRVTYRPERQLKPLDKLTGPQIALVSKYFVPGKIVAKLAPPKNATDEDLE